MPVTQRSYYDAAEQGRRDRMLEQTNMLNNQIRQQEVDQGNRLNALYQDPQATPEQYARVGRSDIANSLTGAQNAVTAAKAAQVREFATQITNAARYVDQVPQGQKKAFVEQNFPFLVKEYGPTWATDDEAHIEQQMKGIAAKFGVQAGVAPPVQFTTKAGPRGSIIQENPVTGEQKQVIGPDNSQPNPNAGNTASSREFKNIQGLRKEFDGQQAVKDYKLIVPLYRRALTAPDTRAGDLSIIYALGKMFDPGSVVREGELTLSQNTAPWLQKIVSTANSQLSGQGALNSETRKAIIEALKGQMDSLRQSYNIERDRFSGYANDNGWAPGQVVGQDPGGDFEQLAPAAQPSAAASTANEPTATGPNGQKIVYRGGKWQPL